MKLRTIFLATALSVATFAQAPLFPLAMGNQWIYRDHKTGDSFSVRVGLPLATGEYVYYRLIGYTPQPVWARYGEDGNLYALNEEAGRDVLLASFTSPDPYPSPVTDCNQMAQLQEKRVPYTARGAMDVTALEIRYQSGACADAGVEREHFVENIGMVRRFVTTLSGPRVYELDHASIGPMRFSLESGAASILSVETSHFGRRDPREAVVLQGSLRYSAQRNRGVKLDFPTLQRIDLQLVNDKGEVVWKWSDKYAFGQAADSLWVTGEAVWTFREPLERNGVALPDGEYRLEGWLTGNSNQREVAASASIIIETVPR